MKPVTIELTGPVSPERLIADLRKQVPHLIRDGGAVPAVPLPAPRKHPGLAAEPLLTPAEVATMFRVDPKTVTRWAKAGKITSIRTLGGHRRYRETEIRALLGGVPQPRSE